MMGLVRRESLNRVPSGQAGGHQFEGRGVIVARRRSPTAPGSRPSFFDLDFPFADSSNVEDDFDFNTSIGPGDAPHGSFLWEDEC
jgi:hypothetical protein